VTTFHFSLFLYPVFRNNDKCNRDVSHREGSSTVASLLGSLPGDVFLFLDCEMKIGDQKKVTRALGVG
jgi:hypothetical protein